MATQTTALTAAGNTATISLAPGQSLTYSSSGTFTGDWAFRRSRTQGATWQDIERPAVNVNVTGGAVKNETNAEERYRFELLDDNRTTPGTPIVVTGTVTAVVSDASDTVRHLRDDNGRVYGYVTDNGVVFSGDMTVGTLLAPRVTSADVITSSTPGTPAASVTAVEYGDSRVRTTVLTLTSFAVGLSGDLTNLARGATLYTFPAGEIIVEGASINVGLTLADAIQTDTPEIGLGTVACAGEAQATLGAVGATAENIMEGVAVANVAGTAKVNTDTPTANVPLVIATGAAHTVCLNVADGWADLTAPAAITATGTVVLNWRFMS